MLGTIERTGEIATRLNAIREAFDARRSMSLAARHELNACLAAKSKYTKRPHMAHVIRGLQRCLSLSESFRVVDRDPAVTREALHKSEGYNGTTTRLSIPLVFACKLPLPRVYTQTISSRANSWSVKAVVPQPTPKALKELKKHRDKFEWIELWWVPNDVLIERLPDPDPIVVGAVQIEHDRTYYFELHRWVDETVELGWWSKEGY